MSAVLQDPQLMEVNPPLVRSEDYHDLTEQISAIVEGDVIRKGELLARLDALSRRVQGGGTQTSLRVGDLHIDLLSRKASRGARSIAATAP